MTSKIFSFSTALALALIGLPEKEGQPYTHDWNGHFIYQERWLPSIAVWFEADVRFFIIDAAGAVTREALFDEELELFPNAFVLSAPTAAGDHKSD